MHRILIVNEHPLERRGLAVLIDDEPDLAVCGQVASHRDGIEGIVSFKPDLVIADLSINDGKGLELVKAIRSSHKDLPILMLSNHQARNDAEDALMVGATACVSKREKSLSLLLAIRRALGGGDSDPGVQKF